MRRARDTVFWLGMSKDIKLLTDNCNICQALKPCNPNEPLRQHNEGRYPWEKCGVDLFELNGKTYLIVVDYFSNFFEIDVLTTTTSMPSYLLYEKAFCSIRYNKNDCF